MKKKSYSHNNPSISSKTLVNLEKGFLHLQCMFRLQMCNQNGNMKKNVLFSPLFLYNLALIAHDVTKSVNPSIKPAKWFKSRSLLSFRTLSSLLIKSWLRTSLTEVILIWNRGRKSIISRSLAVPKPRSRRCCLMFVNFHHNGILSLVFSQFSASPSPSEFPLLKLSLYLKTCRVECTDMKNSGCVQCVRTEAFDRVWTVSLVMYVKLQLRCGIYQ